MADNKITCGPRPWIFPLPVSIAGIDAGGKAEYTYVHNCGPLCVTPPTIYISLSKANPLSGIIKEKGYFSLNTPSTSLLPLIAGLSADKNTETDVKTLYSDNKTPYVSECPINLICKVADTFSMNDMEIIIGRVENTCAGTQYLAEGNRNPDMDRIDPILYSPDRGYYSIGKYLGEAFSIGNCYGKGIFGIIKHLLRSNGKKSILKGYSSLLYIKKLISGSRRQPYQKKEIPARSLIYPLPAVLLGSYVNDKPNYSVIGNSGIISVSPPVVYASSNRSHYTNTGIIDRNSFSINIPDASLIKKTDYCGIVSGRKTDKSKVFTTFSGTDSNIPLIKECPVNLECRVIKVYRIKHMEIFIGEVIESHISEKCLKDGEPDIQKINPIVYALNRKYWSVGKFLFKK